MVLLEHIERFVSEYKQGDINAQNAQIELAVSPAETVVRIDPTHLSQTLTNLVSNGIRYSEENGNGPTVLLEGGVDPSSDRPYLNIIDFGSGVSPDQLPSLFQPFSTTSQLGTGLGLYISKELCEANQARLTYIRHDQGGSCFRILFAHPDRITA